MSERQTLSYLQRRFQSAGLQPRTRYGQNFLIDLNLVELIARSAELSPRDVVLEVGTGMGSLTKIMAGRAGHVVTVEVDGELAELAGEELASCSNVTLLQTDALRNKNELSPLVLETIRSKMSEVSGARFKLVANLPYNVATPILSNLLHVDPWPQRMVATIQRELAQRIAASPRSKDYSALSVWMQSQCRVEIVRTLPPSVFWPRPKVESAIIDIRPQRVFRQRIVDVGFFHDLVRKIFLHRRKFLRSALLSAVKGILDKAAVDQVLAEMGLTGQERAEELTPQQMIELVDCVRRNAVRPPE
ncbi:MAG: ribosomal RNA small subunit methyltransferase A [Planctomycetota bacterium]|nr:MAG: ribosomal RNA small subunit methyltransferase A [Planctomycetota bacterium]